MGDHERRRASRHRTVRTLVHFAWWDGPTYHRKHAIIMNLSRHGVLLICRFQPPAAGAEVRLTLACHAPEPWLRARVVEASHFFDERWETRLEFASPFPADQLDSALTGNLAPGPTGGRLDPPPQPHCMDEPAITAMGPGTNSIKH